VKKDLKGVIDQQWASPTGRYILWYDSKAKTICFDGNETRNITAKIKPPLCDEENDVPDDPSPYGVMGWQEGDSSVYVYDRYDVWKVDLYDAGSFKRITNGRSPKNSYRYLKVDPDERFIRNGQPLHFRVFNDSTKSSGIVLYGSGATIDFIAYDRGYSYGNFLKAKERNAYLFSREAYTNSPDLYFAPGDRTDTIRGWHSGGLLQ
jgi:hypothetical protein